MIVRLRETRISAPDELRILNPLAVQEAVPTVAVSLGFRLVPRLLDKLAKLRNKPVVAVCDAGVTSSRAVNKLRNSGFESVYNLKGGMSAWGQAGLPVVSGKKTKSKSKK